MSRDVAAFLVPAVGEPGRPDSVVVGLGNGTDRVCRALRQDPAAARIRASRSRPFVLPWPRRTPRSAAWRVRIRWIM
jgi:hypothetical protein